MKKIRRLKNKEGFIALISVIIVSAILVLIATTLSFSGYFGRYNVFDSELKERSAGLAEACVDEALLRLANLQTIPNDTEIFIGGNKCTIVSVSGALPTTIKTKANFSDSYTNLVVKVNTDPAGITVISSEEVPNF